MSLQEIVDKITVAENCSVYCMIVSVLLLIFQR